MLKVLFVDRDGTLIEEPADNQVDALHKVRLVPGVIIALLRLRDLGYRFVMVSNQDGLGTSSFPQADFDVCQEHALALFASQGIHFDEVFICPHSANDGCDCHKPRTGLLTRYLANNDLDMASCAVVGDRSTDMELAAVMGIRGFQINKGEPPLSWEGICAGLTPGARTGEIERSTSETSIRAFVNLDAATPLTVNTGIGFVVTAVNREPVCLPDTLQTTTSIWLPVPSSAIAAPTWNWLPRWVSAAFRSIKASRRCPGKVFALALQIGNPGRASVAKR